MLQIASITLTNTTGNHRKFWTVEPIGRKRLICKWGRIGSWIQSKVFAFETVQDAVDFAERKVENKLRRGYVMNH